MNIVKENESVFGVKDEVLLEKIKENLANWDGSCYYDDEKVYKKIEEIENVEIKQEIKSLGDNNTSGREEIYFFIGNTELCKGNAIEKICKILEIDLNDTIAIGDDFNDISMFKVVGYSVVMENATDEVKKYADEITLSNEDDGVAVFLEKLLI